MVQLVKIGKLMNTNPVASDSGYSSALVNACLALGNCAVLVDPRTGGSTITESGGKVTNIENLGSAGDFAQAVDAERAVWDGSSKLTFDRSFYSISGAVTLKTVFAVVKVATADGANCIFGDTSTGTQELLIGTAPAYDTDTNTFIGPTVLINGKGNYNAPNDTLHCVHGERYTTAFSYGSGNFALGRQNAANAARDFKGELHFFVGFEDALTESEVNTILGLIATEFTLTTVDLIADPDDISGLLAYWSSTAGITEAGGEISAWTDQKNGIILSQGTGTNQPDTGGALGAKAVQSVHFDGTNDWLEASALDLSSNSLTSIMAVGPTGAPTGANHILCISSTNITTAGSNFVQLYFANGSSGRLNFPVNTLDCDTITSFTSPAIITCKKDNSGGGTSAIYVNGGAAQDTGTGNQNLLNQPFFVGQFGNTGYSNVDMGDHIIYSRALTNNETDQVNTFTARKFGFAILPVS